MHNRNVSGSRHDHMASFTLRGRRPLAGTVMLLCTGCLGQEGKMRIFSTFHFRVCQEQPRDQRQPLPSFTGYLGANKASGTVLGSTEKATHTKIDV